MTLLQTIEQANTAAGIKTFSFARIDEFNSFLQSFNELDVPAHVIVPFQTNGVWLNGMRKVVVPLQGWVLTRLHEDTNNFRSKEIECDYMDPMRKLARNFLREVINSDLTDPEVEQISDTIRPEYAFLNYHLFGVSYTCNWPVIQSVC